MPKTLRRYRHAYLIASLLLVVTVLPFVGNHLAGGMVLEGMLFVALMAGGLATIQSRWMLAALILMAFAALASRITFALTDDSAFALVAFLGCYLTLYGIVAFEVLAFVLWRTKRVTSDTILGAISVYLLLGIVWFLGFAILETLAPGSFAFAETDHAIAPKERFERLIGFSYTTLTTLGYGNIAPATRQADGLATLEAMAGQLYLAVVIARLVALQITQAPAAATATKTDHA